jgi:hypothetical protein
MRSTCLVMLMLLLAWSYPNINSNDKILSANGDTKLFTDTIPPDGLNGLPEKDGKIIISNADSNGLEISPFNPDLNGVLIEPVNRATNTGIPTTFYLKDTSSWSFYTNAQKLITVSGNGSIGTSAPFLINNAAVDGKSSLRVNGNLRSDTSVSIQGSSDSISFISLNRNIRDGFFEPDDKISPYASNSAA